jgi:hypothetical protein
MEIKNGNQKRRQEKRKSFRAGDGMTPETASPRQSTRNQLKQTVELLGSIVGESGKSGKKTISAKRGTGRVSSAKPERPCLESLHFRSKEM